MRRAAAIVAAALVGLGALAGAAFAGAPAPTAAPAGGQLTLTPVPGAKFPSRQYLLTSSAGLTVSPQQISVSENGQPVKDLSVQSGNAVGQSHFGTVLLISNSSTMQGARIQAAVQAARTFLQVRNPQQPVGIMYFDNSPLVVAPMTTDTATLSKTLAVLPVLGQGRRIFDGAEAALQVLRSAGVEHGTIILLSDGQDTGSAATVQQVANAARAQGVRFIGIGVLAPVQGNALHTLSGATQGVYRTVASGDLTGLYQHLANELSHQYTISYQSTARLGSPVSVGVAVPGVGSTSATYVAPTLTAPLAPGTVRHSSFFTSGLFSGLVVGIGGILIGFAVLVVTRRRQAVASRVGDFVNPNQLPAEPEKSLVERALGDPRARSIGRSPIWAVLVDEMDIGNVRIAPLQLVLGTAVLTAGLAFLLAEATGSPIAMLMALFVPSGVFVAIRMTADRQRRLFDEQLPDNLQVIASAMRAGNTFMGAMNVVVQDAPEPSRRELRRALTDEQLGVSIGDALEGVTKRMRSEDFQHVAVVATLQRDTGGNTAEVIDLVTDTIRERLELRRMVRALTAQGRLAGILLTALPVAILVIVSLINPTYVQPLFHREIGIIALVSGGAMVVAGGYLINRIVNIDV